MSTKSRALCIGINYTGSSSALQGCINDAKNLSALLNASGAVASANIQLLCEATAAQIHEGLTNLAQKCKDDKLTYAFISYSGHGTQVADLNKDETDGKDECICPSDFTKSGVITDDMLKDRIAQFPSWTTVCFLCDACHSGSMLDLNHTYVNSIDTVSGTNSLACKVVMISGCRDNQTSADAFDQSSSAYTGAMTSAMLKSLKNVFACRTDVIRLVAEMRKVLRAGGFSQYPVLSTSFTLPRQFAFIPYTSA
ncbi:peptidase C14, caspase domain-containing protein [Tribonema minus]|uniref:Peptidase C14, caspase domain-containing protein n=1 Tax=Tribonema minus TaxID=303371 RepID=A0A836CI31_9STRA|nr:peptidase C14, caspase domain-containing protein [Tribonema minus]